MGVKITPGGLKRIVATTTENERGYRNPPPSGLRFDRTSFHPGLRPYHITSTIGPRTSVLVPTPGSGEVYTWNGSQWVEPFAATLFNRWNATVPIGYGECYWAGGDWHIFSWDCP